MVSVEIFVGWIPTCTQFTIYKYYIPKYNMLQNANNQDQQQKYSLPSKQNSRPI
jgi:hypothetical protein